MKHLSNEPRMRVIQKDGTKVRFDETFIWTIDREFAAQAEALDWVQGKPGCSASIITHKLRTHYVGTEEGFSRYTQPPLKVVDRGKTAGPLAEGLDAAGFREVTK